MRIAARMYAAGLAAPASPATVAGRTKIPDPMTPLTAIAVRPASPTARTRRGGEESVTLRNPPHPGPLPEGEGAELHVVQYRQRRAAEDLLLLIDGDLHRVDRRDGAVDRA